MNTKNISLGFGISFIPFAYIGWLAAGLGGAKLAIAILLMFAMTLWIIAYALKQIES